jgi:hypothetical protein
MKGANPLRLVRTIIPLASAFFQPDGGTVLFQGNPCSRGPQTGPPPMKSWPPLLICTVHNPTWKLNTMNAGFSKKGTLFSETVDRGWKSLAAEFARSSNFAEECISCREESDDFALKCCIKWRRSGSLTTGRNQ